MYIDFFFLPFQFRSRSTRSSHVLDNDNRQWFHLRHSVYFEPDDGPALHGGVESLEGPGVCSLLDVLDSVNCIYLKLLLDLRGGTVVASVLPFYSLERQT